MTVGDITTTTPIQNTNISLITDDAANKLSVDANSTTLSGISYTQRLKLNGTGSITKRALKITNVAAGTYTIDFGHGSSSGDARELFITTDGTTEIATFSVNANEKKSSNFTLSENKEVIYIYSKSSGINIYGIHQ